MISKHHSAFFDEICVPRRDTLETSQAAGQASAIAEDVQEGAESLAADVQRGASEAAGQLQSGLNAAASEAQKAADNISRGDACDHIVSRCVSWDVCEQAAMVGAEGARP